MNKKILLSLLLVFGVSGQCLASSQSEEEDLLNASAVSSITPQMNTPRANLTELATENFSKYVTGCAKKAAVKEIRTLITDNAPGLAPVIGVMYLYSGSASDKEKYEGTLARTAGNTVKIFVEELGGEVVVELLGKLKPNDADTLTEALIRACARKYASIRTSEGYSAMIGDGVSAAVKSIPYVGAPVAAIGKTLGQYIDPDAKSLTEATMRTTKNYIAQASTLSLMGDEQDDVEYEAQFNALEDEELKAKIIETFGAQIDEYKQDPYAEYNPYEDMITMYAQLKCEDMSSDSESGQDAHQGSWWGFW